MERKEAYDAAGLNRLQVHAHSASAAVICSNVEQFEVEITGTGCDKQISDIAVKAENGMLSIRQPASPPGRQKMQIRVFIPVGWKGEINARTSSGLLEAMGLRGTDVTLGTVSGALEAASIEAITLSAGTVSGAASISGVMCDQLQLRSISGHISAEGCDFRTARFRSVSGSCIMQTVGSFDTIRSMTASGCFTLTLPFCQADAVFRTLNGRLRTSSVDLTPGAPEIRMNTLSGHLTISGTTIVQQE